MSLLRQLLAAKPVRTQLEFGIQANVRLISMNNTTKLRDGVPVPTNTFLTFGQFNDKNELIAQSEFDYYNLNNEYDNVIPNLSTQVSQLTSIVEILNPGHEFDPTSAYEDYDELVADSKSKKGCKSLMDSVWKAFNKAVGKKVGMESPLMRLKVVVDYKTGKYTQLGNDGIIVEANDIDESDVQLKITTKELKDKAKSLIEVTTAKADAGGDKPTQAADILDI